MSNNYSSCQKSLNSLIQVLSLQAKYRLKFVTGSNSITCSIIRVFVNLFLCILKKKESMKIFMAISIFTKLMSLWVRLENILDIQYLFRMMNACIMNHRVWISVPYVFWYSVHSYSLLGNLQWGFQKMVTKMFISNMPCYIKKKKRNLFLWLNLKPIM